MDVIAKFRCHVKKEIAYASSKSTEVELYACVDKVNAEWAAATPVGTLKMVIENQAAADQLIPGVDYFITISPVTEVARSTSGAA